MNETYCKGEGRQKATDAMRDRAKMLEDEARQWRSLAAAMDEVEKYALTENAKSEGDGPVPYIGVGSGAEVLLWRLATSPLR